MSHDAQSPDVRSEAMPAKPWQLYSSYNTSWLIYMLCYLGVILYMVIMAWDMHTSKYFLLLLASLGMLLTRTTYLVPVTTAVLSITSLGLSRHFNLHNAQVLGIFSSIVTFMPILLSYEIVVSLPHKHAILARRISITFILPGAIAVFLYAVLGASLGSQYTGRAVPQLLDLVLAMPYADLSALVESQDVFGRLWYAMYRLLYGLIALLFFGILLRTVHSYDESKELADWHNRWRTNPSRSMSVYTSPATVAERTVCVAKSLVVQTQARLKAQLQRGSRQYNDQPQA